MAMIILSLAGFSNAQNQWEKYEIVKGKFEEAREKFELAKESSLTNEILNGDRLKIIYMEYLERTIDYLVVRLETLKYRIENGENKEKFSFNASSNLDTRIMQLETIRMKIRHANSSLEFKSSIRDLDDVAIKTILETRYYVGIMKNNRNDLIFAQAENITVKIDAKIERLRTQSKYTRPVEGGLHLPSPFGFAFNNNIIRITNQTASLEIFMKETKDNHRKTLELYFKHAGFDSNGMVTNEKDAHAFLDTASVLQKDTINKINIITKNLSKVFNEVKIWDGHDQ